MKLDTAINHQTRAITAIRDVYSMAKSFGMSHDAVMDRAKVINASIAHCPRHVIERVRGYEQCLFDMLFQHELEFCYMVDGEQYSTWRNSIHKTTDHFYRAGKGSILSAAPCAHFWKGTNKPFSAVKPI